MMNEKENLSFYDIIVTMSQAHYKMKGGGYSDGLRFDQKHKVISFGKTILYDKGIVPQTIKFCDVEFELTKEMEIIETVDNPYEELETLYKQFRYSVPNPYTNCLANTFLAVTLDELTYEQFENGIRRQEARAMLEGFVMLTEFPWENEKHHYWQSSNDKNLVLLRQYATA